MEEPHLKNIAIAGASGVIGIPVIKHLFEGGKHNIIGLNRAASKAELPEGIKVASVDYDDESSLIEELKGQDVLLNCLSVATPHDTERRLIRAAAAAGVQWMVPKEWSPDITSDPQMRQVY
jgi:saccharopine dehydrogenase-like NADP-dependent oxidoreductase